MRLRAVTPVGLKCALGHKKCAPASCLKSGPERQVLSISKVGLSSQRHHLTRVSLLFGLPTLPAISNRARTPLLIQPRLLINTEKNQNNSRIYVRIGKNFDNKCVVSPNVVQPSARCEKLCERDIARHPKCATIGTVQESFRASHGVSLNPYLAVFLSRQTNGQQASSQQATRVSDYSLREPLSSARG